MWHLSLCILGDAGRKLKMKREEREETNGLTVEQHTCFFELIG